MLGSSAEQELLLLMKGGSISIFNVISVKLCLTGTLGGVRRLYKLFVITLKKQLPPARHETKVYHAVRSIPSREGLKAKS